MAKIVFVLVCVAFIQIASALECYHCEKDGCNQDKKQWQKPKCGSVADTTQENVCEKKVYKETATNKEVTLRKCSIAPKTGDYQCTTPVDGTSPTCSICKTDLCNSAPSAHLSAVAFTGMVLAALVPKFLL